MIARVHFVPVRLHPKNKDANPWVAVMAAATMRAHVEKMDRVHPVWQTPRFMLNARPWNMHRLPCENCKRRLTARC